MINEKTSTQIWAEKAKTVLTKLVDEYCKEVRQDGDPAVFDDLLKSKDVHKDIVVDFVHTISDNAWVEETLKEEVNKHE